MKLKNTYFKCNHYNNRKNSLKIFLSTIYLCFKYKNIKGYNNN